MCRHEINLLNHEGQKNLNHWNLIDIDNEEYMSECNTIFQNAFSDFISN
jgi:hypothetical protein